MSVCMGVCTYTFKLLSCFPVSGIFFGEFKKKSSNLSPLRPTRGIFLAIFKKNAGTSSASTEYCKTDNITIDPRTTKNYNKIILLRCLFFRLFVFPLFYYN